MYENILSLLEMQEVKFEKGLTLDELNQIERIYQVKLPRSLRQFLMTALPISRGFYNWRNIQDDNIRYIKKVLNKPLLDIYNMAEEIYWCDNWGEKPEDEKIIVQEIRARLKKAPKLLPIYAHRYMPIVLDENPPVISIHDIDIIYYGENLEDYFNIEFGKKEQNTIAFKNITPIPFWSDIM